jgi:hypothetical protein
VRRIPRSPVSYADADQGRRRRLPTKWLAAMLITAAVALLAPGVTYVTADRSSTAAGTTTMTATTTMNTTAAKTWRVTVYSARRPGGLTVASRAFTLKRGWHWRGFGMHQAYQGLSAVCVTATESFGTSCVHFSGPAS